MECSVLKSGLYGGAPSRPPGRGWSAATRRPARTAAKLDATRPSPYRSQTLRTVRLPARAFLPGLVCILLAVHAGPAPAQYKWKDSRGQTHVSDLPPPADIPERSVLQRPTPRSGPAAAGPIGGAAATAASASASPAASRAAVDPEIEARRRRAEQEARDKARADEQRQAELRAGNCQRARERLAMLDSGQRMVRIDADGERTVVDDDSRAADAQQARRVIDTDCR